jgi:hypothetical protein
VSGSLGRLRPASALRWRITERLAELIPLTSEVLVPRRADPESDLEGVAKQFADNVEWESPDTLPNGGVTRGRDRG